MTERLSPDLVKHLRSKGISVEQMDTVSVQTALAGDMGRVDTFWCSMYRVSGVARGCGHLSEQMHWSTRARFLCPVISHRGGRSQPSLWTESAILSRLVIGDVCCCAFWPSGARLGYLQDTRGVHSASCTALESGNYCARIRELLR